MANNKVTHFTSSLATTKTQNITGAGAIDVRSSNTALNTTSTDAYTLGDGDEGQFKTIILESGGGANTATITPTNLLGFTTLVFNAIGEGALLQFLNGSWVVLATNGGVLA